MRVIVFDTETTGLPKSYNINQDTLNSWPHIVQFSYIIYDDETTTIVEKDWVVKVPEEVLISEDSVKIHGITKEITVTKGFDLHVILNEFFDDIKDVNKLIGHNVAFDMNMIKVALLRNIYFNKNNLSANEIKECKRNLSYLTNYKNITCTLQDSINLCNIQAIDKFGRSYIKFPKLVELHQKLFETQPNNMHNSLNDVLVTLRCYFKMHYDTDLYITSETYKDTANRIHLF